MLGRAAPARFRHDLIQQPTAPMPAITDSARNSCQPHFQGRAQRVWKKNGNIKTRLPSDCANGCEQRLSRQGNNFVHFGNQFPDRRDVRRRGDRDMCVGTTFFDRAHSGRANHAVTQPVASANQHPKRLQIFCGNVRRQIYAPFVASEEKIRPGSFPAIVHPEPIFRCTANLLRHHFVRLRGERFDRFAACL